MVRFLNAELRRISSLEYPRIKTGASLSTYNAAIFIQVLLIGYAIPQREVTDSPDDCSLAPDEYGGEMRENGFTIKAAGIAFVDEGKVQA